MEEPTAALAALGAREAPAETWEDTEEALETPPLPFEPMSIDTAPEEVFESAVDTGEAPE